MNNIHPTMAQALKPFAPNDRAVSGNNKPPVAVVLQLASDTLVEDLTREGADLIKRGEDLMAAFGRCPQVIDNDELAGKMSDFSVQIGTHLKALETKREADKRPIISAGKVLDGFYKSLSDPLSSAKSDVGQRITVWLRHKENQERARLAEEARVAREAEEKARREAEAAAASVQSEGDLQAAIQKEHVAEQAQVQAVAATQAMDAKPADLSRTRGTGSVASLKSVWEFEITSLADVDLNALRPYIAIGDLEKAIRGAVKAGVRPSKEGVQPIKGVRIYEERKAGVR